MERYHEGQHHRLRDVLVRSGWDAMEYIHYIQHRQKSNNDLKALDI